jgi:DNA-binding beta-propeller fold protein YncE
MKPPTNPHGLALPSSFPLRTAALVLFVPALAGCEPRAALTTRLMASDSAATGFLVHELGTGESEVVDVVSDGERSLVFVVSPSDPCEEPDVPSYLSVLEFHPSGRSPRERHVIDLGDGEATSVAAGPGGRFALVAQKHPSKPATGPGSLLVVRDGSVLRAIPIGPGPDSVAVAPSGDLAVVACEAEKPDDDCEEEDGAPDLPGSIQVLALGGPEETWKVVAEVGAGAISDRIGQRDGSRKPLPAEVEPEFTAISPDGLTALVTLQEQSAIAVLDLGPARTTGERTEKGSSGILADVILLDPGRPDTKGVHRGTHPDGIAFSPDGALAITANEAHSKSRELQGISIIDLRGGPGRARVVGTHSVFDLDPSLRDAKQARRKPLPRVRKTRAGPQLPRLDPEGIAITRFGERTIAAVAIERNILAETAGSVLFLDVTRAHEGEKPVKIARHIVGANPGARPETLDFTEDGRWLFVASERDGGTITLIPSTDLAAGLRSSDARKEDAR